ncbi:hypothetical protein MRB53_035185 [Persea americana]|uniref:Uncharacterized protein n=1 Tax=Persea americana TaxID=3435 RepID=A0ACC2K458_PERAE|nr:hypothetical protein MRB53_035185 [Persea americana]
MANPNKNQQNPSKPPKTPQNQNPTSISPTITTSETEETNPPPPKPHLLQTPLSISGSQEDTTLHRSEFLTREEVLRRRSRRVKQLAKYYRTQYWALMEEVRVKHLEYYWKYGKSPFQEEEGEEVGGERSRELGFGESGCNETSLRMCSFSGCESKAMALTSYCHSHILCDSKQKLYKACSYVLKSDQTGPVICGKPILRAAVPSLCTAHFQKGKKHVSQALKKAGFTSTASKPAPKFHVIIAEFVHQIQSKRREAQGCSH